MKRSPGFLSFAERDRGSYTYALTTRKPRGRGKLMAYSNKAKQLRRCKKLKTDGTQCRAYARINGQFCSLHGYDHKTKKLPKKNEREAARIRRVIKRAQTQPHQTCDCPAYGWRHRAGSGICKFPDQPEEKFVGGDVEPVTADEQCASSAGGSSYWERVIEDSGSVQYSEDYLPDLDSQEVPTDREVREAWNREKLKRLIERETEKQASDLTWHY